MSKARARERAKARAAGKAKKRSGGDNQAAANIPSGRFDPKDNSFSNPTTTASGKNLAGARRGAARSR